MESHHLIWWAKSTERKLPLVLQPLSHGCPSSAWVASHSVKQVEENPILSEKKNAHSALNCYLEISGSSDLKSVTGFE